jgi:replicative DNA helicase
VITGDLPEAGKEIALKASDHMRKSQFYSITISDLDIHSLEVVLRRYKAKLGIQIAFVDYVGRMDTQDKKLQEWQVLVRIAKKLKTLAQQLGMVIFMVAQQTKEGYLQGAKAMENEATVFMVLDRPKDVEANLDDSRDHRIAKKLGSYRELGADGAIILLKNRVGAEGRILIKFHEDQLRFEEVV